MDHRQEVREFLTTRRARITPDQVGIPTSGNRRVPGLRRSEVATIAGLSVEHYAKLERGQIAGASTGVLDALARALRLDETERAHLFDLARAADGIPTSGRARRRTPSKAASRLSLQLALDAISDGVAFVRDPRQNLLATNALGRAFYAPVIGDGGRAPNLARFHDRTLQDLVGELSTQSETFRLLWADHNVRTHGAGTKRFDHPLAVTTEPGLVLMVYTAEPASPSAERLQLLASWGTPHPPPSPLPPRPTLRRADPMTDAHDRRP